MVDTNKLRGIIAENRITNRELSKRLGITESTFYKKMKKGVFGSDEIEIMIDTLRPEDPMAIFFAKHGT